jgi:hypothetical protein
MCDHDIVVMAPCVDTKGTGFDSCSRLNAGHKRKDFYVALQTALYSLPTCTLMNAVYPEEKARLGITHSGSGTVGHRRSLFALLNK